MLLTGIVTDVNEQMLSFELNGTTTVQMLLLLIENPTQKLPQKGTPIKINTYFSLDKEILILSPCPEIKIEGDLSKSVNLEENKVFKIVKNLKLEASDLLEIVKSYKGLRRHFLSPHGIASEDFLEALLEKVGTKFGLKFISQENFVSSDPEMYKDFEYWTFGNHWNWVKNAKKDYLIGYLYVSTSNGLFLLTDFQREIPFLVTNCQNFDVSSILNCYIIVQEYTIFTEIYNSAQFSSLEYICVDCNDITVLDLNQNCENYAPKNVQGQQRSLCKIIAKSMPMINALKNVELWLHIIQEEKNQSFLCLNASYSKIYPTLRQGRTYHLYYRNIPKKIYNKEISLINPCLPQFELGENAHFIPVPISKNTENYILDLETANRKLVNSHGLISFEAKLSVKKFKDPLGSRTAKVAQNMNFGTPGPKTHLLEFKTDETFPLSVYLNNWENMAVPYGLVPNMKIIIYNLKSQRGKYYKSTALTSIELVSYDPRSKYESANLSSRSNWGIPYFLAAPLPENTIIWTKTLSLSVSALTINTKFQPDNGKSDWSVEITLIVEDLMGESEVFAKDKSGLLLLKFLLGAQETVFQNWCKGIELLDKYNYWKGKEITEDGPGPQNTVRHLLDRHLDLIDELWLCLDLKCRKMDEISGKQVYFLLDVRKS